MHYFVFIVVQIQATRGATLRNVLELTNKTMQSNEIVYLALGQWRKLFPYTLKTICSICSVHGDVFLFVCAFHIWEFKGGLYVNVKLHFFFQ